MRGHTMALITGASIIAGSYLGPVAYARYHPPTHLYLVVYDGEGEIGGAAGPLPYDLTECHRRADEFRAIQRETAVSKIDARTGKPADPEELRKALAVRMECRLLRKRPYVRLEPLEKLAR